MLKSRPFMSVRCLALVIGLCMAVGVLAKTDAVQFEDLGDGLFLSRAQAGPATPENLGRTGNIAFVQGPGGVIVWNSGVSYLHGQQVLASVLRHADRPIRLMLVSHAYQDVLFGWQAFTEIGIDFWMHRGAHELMNTRCHQCLATLNRMFGSELMYGTDLAKPTRIIESGARIDSVIDRPLEILDLGHSSGPNDLALFDHQTGTLFAGPLVMTTQLVQIRDGRVADWIDALEKLQAMPIKQVIPDYGEPADASAITRTRGYLLALQGKAQELLKTGVSLSSVAELGELPEFSTMGGYELEHARNVHQMYLRLERTFFENSTR